MKKLLLIFVLSFSMTAFSSAQNTFPSTGAAGIGTLAPNASSLLDVTSTTKGVLVPRMTKTQRDAITSPAIGLLIYQTNSVPGFYYYSGTVWTAVSAKNKGWNLTGNSGTNPSIDFIGTTDAQPLVLKVNNQKSGYIDYYGDNNSNANTGFGYETLNTNTTGYHNTASGFQALFSNTTGEQNTANGYQALYSNTAGLANIASGSYALNANTTGTYNTAIGYIALRSNTTGNYNTANGHQSLYSNTTGDNNSADGEAALFSNTTGYYNTASGSNALFSNTTGYQNAANGGNALYFNTTGFWNTADGYAALYYNTTGSDNTANGMEALYFNTTGSDNEASGQFALWNNTTGTVNTAIGHQALYSNTTARQNTAIGEGAMYSNSTGNDNEAIGQDALYSNTTGTSNAANGQAALLLNTTGIGNTATGGNAMQNNTTGSHNTANGNQALVSNITGNDNTADGAFADVNNGNYNNSSVFGNSALITADNQVRIGNSSVTSIGGFVDWSNISDGRFKKNIKDDVKGLEFINKLNPITYTLDLHGVNNFLRKDMPEMKTADGKIIEQPKQDEGAMAAKEKVVYSGFIAQDVEKSAKEIGYDFSGIDAPKNDKDVYGLRYSDFVVPLVKAVQELSKQNDDLKTQNTNMQKEIDDLKTTIGSSSNSNMSNGFAKLSFDPSTSITLLGQNVPNPFDNSTLIPFRIPKDCHDASIMVTNISSSEVVRVIPVSCNEDHVSIDAGTLASGTYSYTLYVDGKMIDTKQMILTK